MHVCCLYASLLPRLWVSWAAHCSFCASPPSHLSTQHTLAKQVAKQISTRGVDYEHILFCDYF